MPMGTTMICGECLLSVSPAKESRTCLIEWPFGDS
jgi:hypothetical protein